MDTTTSISRLRVLREPHLAPPAPSGTLQVASPYLASEAPLAADNVTVTAPDALSSETARATPEELADASLSHRLGLAGFCGLSLVAGLLGATTSAQASIPPSPELSELKTLQTQGDPIRGGPGKGASTPTTRPATGQQGAGRVRVFGQEIGGVQNEVPGVTWETYKGTRSGQGYSIEYPQGWKVTKVFNGLAVFDPQDPSTAVLFQWRQGQGQMTPAGLSQQLLADARATQVQVVRGVERGPQNSPVGALYTQESEVRYWSEDQPLHAEITAAVANAPGSYVPFWTGNVVAVQSSEAQFKAKLPVLHHIVNSFASE